MARELHPPRGGLPTVRRAILRRSARKSARPWRGSSGRRCRPRHWRGPLPGRSALPPCRPRPRRPAPPPGWRYAAPPAALRPDGFADRPWRVFRPWRALEPRGAYQNAHTFNVLSDKRTYRFEEVDNYSDLMTRRVRTAIRGGLADRAVQSLTGSQRPPVSMRRAGTLRFLPSRSQGASGPNQ